jgi:hypothetical protein
VDKQGSKSKEIDAPLEAIDFDEEADCESCKL